MTMTDPNDVRRQFEAAMSAAGIRSANEKLWSWFGYQAALQSPAVRELVEAMRPLADLAELFDDEMRGGNMPKDDGDNVMCWPRMHKEYELKVGHLRASRAALRTLGAGHE